MKNVTRSSFLSGAGLALSMCLMAQAAAAQDAATQDAPPPAAPASATQDAPPPPAKPASDSNAGGLEEIIVTAQKRSENLQNVPIAVTALSGSQLAGANIDGQQMLPKITPNLNFSTISTFASTYIRGVGTQFANPGLEASVSVYFDDVYMPRSAAALFSFNDVARIEVLKGPQGTLYGRNSTGGAVRIITNDPKHKFEGAASATYGSFATFNIDGMINIPLGENLAVRFAGKHAENDGYVRNLAVSNGVREVRAPKRLMDRNEELYTGKLLYESGPFKFKLSGDYMRKDDTEGNAFINRYASAPEQFAATDPASVPVVPGLVVVPGTFGGHVSTGYYDVYADGLSYSHVKSWGLAGRFDYDVGPATLSSITGYRNIAEHVCADVDATDANAAINCGNPHTNQLTQELQITSNHHGSLRYVAGLYFLRESSGYLSMFTAPYVFGLLTQFGLPFHPNTALVTTDAGVLVKSIAPYVQVDYEFSRQFAVTAGLRYTKEKKRLRGGISYFGNTDLATGFPDGTTPIPQGESICDPGGPGVPAVTYPCENAPRTVKFNKLTPKITLSFRPADKILLYATFGRGFKSGGFNTPSASYVDSVRPEVLDDYEIGWKIERGNVRWNGAAFFYNYKDLQISTTDSQGQAHVTNATGAHVKGLESDITWAATEQFEFGMGAGYLDSKYRNFRGDAYYTCGQLASLSSSDPIEQAGINAGQFTCALPLPIGQGGLGGVLVANQNLTGNRTINAPKFTAYLRGQYTQPLEGLGNIVISAIGNYRSKAYYDSANLFVDRRRFLLSGKVTWTSENRRYFVSAYGENLTNKKYDASRVTTFFFGGWRTPAAPREVFVQAGVKF